MRQVPALVAARSLGPEAEREVSHWKNLHHSVMYLEALKSHSSYRQIAAYLEGVGCLLRWYTMVLKDARCQVAIVVVVLAAVWSSRLV
mmetsp:Transcript_11662/g.19477  ORF Transcript_11662/g.19477 Transcript_11662/m.19477 type:complete len:88 (+) Transcript_11662:66-329(+)